jgi:phosphomevalonate kinase
MRETIIMANETKEQETERLLQQYFESWKNVLYQEQLLDEANSRWMKAKSRLFEKRSRDHCEAVLNFLQKKTEESGEDKYRVLAQDLKFWIEANPRQKKLKRS